MTKRQFAAIVITAIVACITYAIVLQVIGQHDQAERFIEWAFGGLGALCLFVLMFVELDR